MQLDVLKQKSIDAYKRIRSNVRHTAIDYSPWLSASGEANVYIKWGEFIMYHRSIKAIFLFTEVLESILFLLYVTVFLLVFKAFLTTDASCHAIPMLVTYK